MIQEWWYQLAPRERILVGACAIIVVLALLWTLAVRPLFQGSALLAEQVASKQSQLSNMQELAARVQAGGNSTPSGNRPASTESLVLIIDRTTRERALASYLKRNQPESSSSVRLRFEGAPFDELVQWLAELQTNHGMTTVSANFDEASTGRVNSSLVLKRQGL